MSDFPDEIGLRGADFHIVAIRLGHDKDGRMRYAMRFEDGTPVRITRAQYKRASCGLIFDTQRGPAVFEFMMKEEGED